VPAEQETASTKQRPLPDMSRSLMLWAALSMFFCLPVGLVAVIAAAGANRKWGERQPTEARAYATQARRWTWGAVIAGLIVWPAFAVGMLSLTFGVLTEVNDAPRRNNPGDLEVGPPGELQGGPSAWDE